MHGTCAAYLQYIVANATDHRQIVHPTTSRGCWDRAMGPNGGISGTGMARGVVAAI